MNLFKKQLLVVLGAVVILITALYFVGNNWGGKLNLGLSNFGLSAGRTNSKEASFEKQENLSRQNEISKLTNQIFATVRQAQQDSSQLSANSNQRQRALVSLAESDPNSAWTAVVPASVSSKLPPSLRNSIEKPISLNNLELEVRHEDKFDPRSQKLIDGGYTYFARTSDGRRRQLFLAGNPEGLVSGTKINLKGYELASGQIIAYYSGSNFVVTASELGEATETLGEQKTLVLLLNYQNQTNPFTKAEAERIMFNSQLNAFYREASYNQTWFSGKVLDWSTLSPEFNNCNINIPLYEDDGDEIGRVLLKNNVNIQNYDRLVLLIGPGNCGGGFGTVGKTTLTYGGNVKKMSISWVGISTYLTGHPFPWSYVDFVTGHELGHNLGVVHANSWYCPNGAILYGTDCEHWEYGNGFDIMGSGSNSLHFNASFKDAFGWFTGSNNITYVGNTNNQYQSYTISSLSPGSTSTAVYSKALGIIPSAFTKPAYYVEYRQGGGFDANLKSVNLRDNLGGVFVNLVQGKWAPASRLLDMSPGVGGLSFVLKPGQEFTDSGRGVSIKLTNDPSLTGTANVMVKTFPAQCIRTNPRITLYPSEDKPGRGEIFYVGSVFIGNEDSATCSNRNFQVKTQSNTLEGLASDPIELPSGEEGGSGYFVSIPNNAPAGNHEIKVIVTDLTTNTIVKTQVMALVLSETLAITTTSQLPTARFGENYFVDIFGMPADIPSDFSFVGGSFPPGIKFTAASSNGCSPNPCVRIGGISEVLGSYRFILKLTYRAQSVNKEFILRVEAPTTLTITTSSSLPNVTVGTSYSTDISASGDRGSYIWSAENLPTGLSLATSNCLTAPCQNPATLVGTPTTAGTYRFTVKVGSEPGNSERASYIASKEFSLTVIGIGTTFSTPSLGAAPSSVGQNQSIIVSWKNIPNLANTSWIGYYSKDEKAYNKYLGWLYIGDCSKTVGSVPKTSGSCDFLIPDPGQYDFRLFLSHLESVPILVSNSVSVGE